MPNVYDFAIGLIQSRPNLANSPIGQNFMQALQNRDVAKGEELANNILESQGIDRNQAMNDIKSRLPNIPFL